MPFSGIRWLNENLIGLALYIKGKKRWTISWLFQSSHKTTTRTSQTPNDSQPKLLLLLRQARHSVHRKESVTGEYGAAKDAGLKARQLCGNRMAVGWGALYVRMEKSCRGYVRSADTRLLPAKKCLLCTLTARSLLHGEYKWRKFVHANSHVMCDMYKGWGMNYTH